MPIKILDNLTSSKIAAGEVIDGPHSVIKELIENSIDANSKTISITIEGTGKKLIRVSDDGCGMSLSDLKLCLYRHSTSKITKFDDLEKLSSYGFRGEALFSIFSVSKITITTYDGNSEHGWKLTASGGDFSNFQISPAPPLKGTIVEVKDLFFNTPARLKFLKSDRTLKSSILNIFEKISLIHTNIKFSLTIDGKRIYELDRSQDILNRIEKILNISKNDLIESKITNNEFEIQIFISKPEKLLPSKTKTYIYINKRAVESKIVSSAIYNAFEKINPNKYPFFVVIININPSLIDVNIHPQKREVKFKDDSIMYSTIYNLTQKTINENIKLSKLSSFQNNPSHQLNLKEEYKPYKTNVFTEQNFIDMIYESENNEKKLYTSSKIRFIGQAFSKILIFETENSIILLDQHAAAERITFENYINELESKKVVKQNLAIPIEIKMNTSAIEKIIELKEWFNDAGFEINQTSQSTISVYSYPNLFDFSETEIKELIIYLSEIISTPKLIPHEIKRDAIAIKACKSSIKFNEFISEKKAIELIQNLSKTSDPFRCPHGRPTLIEITKEELSTKFERPLNQL
ncbi:MAG: DNA mismatch repair endonuclease MutL [Elusimicrobiales bacterium]|nr:DNA mismatch repair endonuclease MutL [Elusimicrobiales bacterium]